MFSYACEAGPEIKVQVSMFASALNDEQAHCTINQALYVGSVPSTEAVSMSFCVNFLCSIPCGR